MAEEFDDITNILNELDKSLAEGNVPEGLITDILYLRLPDLKLNDEQKSSLNEKLKAALKKTELSEDLSASLKTDFPNLYAALETAEEINEVADNAPADDKSDKPDENERAPQATDKRAQRIAEIKRTILDAKTINAQNVKQLSISLMGIKMGDAPEEQKEIVAQAIKKIIEKKLSTTGLVKVYNSLNKTQVSKAQELLDTINSDFPAEVENQPTSTQQQNDDIAQLNDVLSGVSDTIQPTSQPDTPQQNQTASTGNNDTPSPTTTPKDSVYDHLKSLLDNAQNITPDELKTGIKAAIAAITSNPNVSDYEYSIIRDAVTKHTDLLTDIAGEMKKKEREAFQQALKNHAAKEGTDADKLTATLETVAKKLQQEEDNRIRQEIEANKERKRQEQQEAAEKRAKCIELIKNRIINAKELSSHSIIMLNNYMVDKEINMKDASKEDKKVVAEALKKVIAKYPNSDVLILAYSSMMGTPKVSSVQELLDTINKDFPSDSSTAENTGNTIANTVDERVAKENQQQQQQQAQSQQSADSLLKADLENIKRLFTETNGELIDNWLKSTGPKNLGFNDDQIKTLTEITANVSTAPGADFGTTFYNSIPTEKFNLEQMNTLKNIAGMQSFVDSNNIRENRNLQTCNSLEDYLLKDFAENEILKRYARTEERDELLKITQKIFEERAAGATTKSLSEMFEEKMNERKILGADGSTTEFSPLVKAIVTDYIAYSSLEQEVQNRINVRQRRAHTQQELANLVNTAATGTDYLKRRLEIDEDLKTKLNLNKEQETQLFDIIDKLKTERDDPLSISQSLEAAITQKMTEASTSTPTGSMDTEYNFIFTPEQIATMQQIAKQAEIIDDHRINDALLKKRTKEEEEARNIELNLKYESLSDDLLFSTDIDEYIATMTPLLDAESLKNSIALKTGYGAHVDYTNSAIALDNPDWLIALKMYHPDLKDTDDSLLDYQKDWMNLSDKPLSEDRKNRRQRAFDSAKQILKAEDKKAAWQQFRDDAKDLVSRNPKKHPLTDEAQTEQKRIKEDINGIIYARLNMLQPGDITPENAYAWLYLAQGTDLSEKISRMVGKVLYDYDQEHFGNRSAEELLESYNQVTKDLDNILSNKGDTRYILEKYEFASKKQEEDILNLASELVIQDYISNPPLNKDPEETKQALINKIADITGNDYKSNKFKVSKNAAIGIMGAGMVKAETFKKRLEANFKGTEIYKNISERLNKFDKKLSKRYGKKYAMAKKIGKIAAKTGWSVSKNIAILTVVTAVAPGIGPAAVIAYNTIKQGKATIAQFKQVQSGTEKTAVLASGLISGAILAAGIAPDVSNLLGHFGLNTPAGIQHLSNGMNTLVGRGARIVAMTMGNTLPNQVKHFSINQKLKKTQKELADKRESLAITPISENDLRILKDIMKDPNHPSFNDILKDNDTMDRFSDKNTVKSYIQLQVLQQKYEALQEQRSQNQQEMIEKAASTALAGGLGMSINSFIGSLLHGHQTEGAATTGATTELATETNEAPQAQPQSEPVPAPEPKVEVVDSLKTEQVADSTSVQQQFAATQQVNDSTSGPSNLAAAVADAQRTEAGDTTQTHTSTQATTESDGKTTNDTGSKTTDDTNAKPAAASQNDQADAQTIEQQHAKNFEAAKVEGTSGHGNMSAHNDTIRHLTNLGDSRFEDINATAQQLSEHLGDKTNMAVIACRMAPTDVYQALGLTGSDTPMTTHAMIDHLANHDLTPEQQTNLNNMLQEKFGNWYSQTETHDTAQDTQTAGDKTQQNDTSSKTAANTATNDTSTTAKSDDAKASAAAAATAVVDKAAATTTGDAKADDATATTGEMKKMDVAPTGDKTVDTLNAKYAVTNGLEGDAKSSMSFSKLSAEEAARLGLRPEQTNPTTQTQQQQTTQTAPEPASQTNQNNDTSSKHATQTNQNNDTSSKHATVTTRSSAPQDNSSSHGVQGHQEAAAAAADVAVPIVYGSVEWARQQGYIWDPGLSVGLNHGGSISEHGNVSNHGYAGAFVNPLTGKVLLIPNDPIADRELVCKYSLDTIHRLQDRDKGPYAPSNSPFGVLNTVLYGSGHIRAASTVEAKVMATASVIGASLEGIRDLLGHHHHKG